MNFDERVRKDELDRIESELTSLRDQITSAESAERHLEESGDARAVVAASGVIAAGRSDFQTSELLSSVTRRDDDRRKRVRARLKDLYATRLRLQERRMQLQRPAGAAR